MKIAYIAHKVGDDVEGNIKKIISIVRTVNLTESDTIPFAPYISDVMALKDNVLSERSRGFKNNRHYFQKGIIDELRLYGPKVSSGMVEEIKWARLYDIPIVNHLTCAFDDEPPRHDFKDGTFEKILYSTLSVFEINLSELKSKKRQRGIVNARKIFVGICYEIIPEVINTLKLGEFLNKDHSTIIYARETFYDLIKTDRDFKRSYDAVKNHLLYS